MSEVTSVQEWKKSSNPKPLQLPSGKTCLARPAGVEAFLQAGIIPNSLMKIISKALSKDKKSEEVDMAELMADVAENPKMLEEVFGMADAVTIYCVIEPAVQPIPPLNEDGTPGARDDDLLYVDEVDSEDKLFILSFGMGGSRDLEAFRKATSGGVGSVSSGEDVRVSPESAAGDS